MAALVIKVTVFERATVHLAARVENPDGNLITQSSLSEINRQIWKRGAGGAADTQQGTEASEVVSTVVYDTLQTPDRWTLDDEGYNFAPVLAKTDIGDEGVYYVDYEFVTTANERYWVRFEVTSAKINFGD